MLLLACASLVGCRESDDSNNPLTTITLAQQAYLKASTPVAGDCFGYSVALSGDTLAVGAPSKDSVRGAVYIFTRSNGVWTLQACITSSNAEAGDNFGWSVALSGDTLVVGAPNEDSSVNGVNGNQADNGAAQSGAAYVFSRRGAVWTQQAYLNASNTEAGDNFGWSVALSGDTLAVGALNEDSGGSNQTDNSASNSGAAYVFSRSGAVWSPQAYIKASNAASNDYFGTTLALDGETLAVGASGKNSSAGAAYVFSRSGVTWTEQAYLLASNTEAGDMFGKGVALSGDSLAVGAPAEDGDANTISNSGAAYVFSRSGATWTQQAYLKASNPEASDYFGISLAFSGETLAVGTYYEDSSATGVNGNQTDNSAAQSGAAYVFSRSGTAWTQQAYLKASNTEAGDHFGFSLALNGDSLAVGARLEGGNGTSQTDNSAASSGAVYLFR